MGDYVRAYAVSQFNKHHAMPQVCVIIVLYIVVSLLNHTLSYVCGYMMHVLWFCSVDRTWS